jgi:hypothetical protein
VYAPYFLPERFQILLQYHGVIVVEFFGTKEKRSVSGLKFCDQFLYGRVIIPEFFHVFAPEFGPLLQLMLIQ